MEKETKAKIISELEILKKSCNEGFTGEWDSSTEEGREGFEAMSDQIDRILSLLGE